MAVKEIHDEDMHGRLLSTDGEKKPKCDIIFTPITVINSHMGDRGDGRAAQLCALYLE